MEAKKINLFIANAPKSFVRLRAKSSFPNVDIIGAGVDYEVVDESGVSEKWFSNQVTAPLIGLSKITRKYLIGEPKVRTRPHW